MTAFVRSWLVMASVALLSHWSWAQAPQYQGMEPRFEGFAPGWGVPYNAGHAAPSNGPLPFEDELLPDHAPLLDFDVFEDLGIKDMFAGTWVQTEFLHANFENPGGSILGAPIAVVPNPRQPFLIEAGDLIGARAIVPDTSQLSLNAQNGMRTTIGIDSFKGFSLVGSWVGMLEMNSQYRVTPGGVDPTLFPEVFDPVAFPNSARFFATSVSGDRLILYDRAFEAALQARYWSADINVLVNYNVPTTGFRMQPLFGFRFNNYEETLVQHGEFDNSSGASSTSGVLAIPTRNTILTSTRNQMVMGQVGFQAELVDKWFTIGMAPKVALGSNSVDTLVYTENLRDSTITETVTDGVTSASSHYVRLGANLDVNGYVKVHVNPWLSLTASAFYWYMPNTSRAHNAINYADNGIDLPPAFRPQAVTSGMSITGFTVGAEARF